MHNTAHSPLLLIIWLLRQGKQLLPVYHFYTVSVSLETTPCNLIIPGPNSIWFSLCQTITYKTCKISDMKLNTERG